MTEIAIRSDAGTALALPAVDTYTKLAQWAQAAEAAHRVAVMLVQTAFVPVAFRNKPFEATAAILAGAEIGLDPLAALRAFDVIQGTAAPRAITLRAVVQSRGHRMWEAEVTPTKVVVRGIRRGEEQIRESIWTIERAKQMGLTGKDNWRNQPMAMLLARATSECARLIAADAILGIPYSAEELADIDPPAASIENVRVATGPVTAAEILGAKPAAQAPPAGVEPPGDEVSEPVAGITAAQQRKLHALLRDKGMDDRDVALVWIAGLLEREITSTKDLNATDAGRVIAELEVFDPDAVIDPGWPEAAQPPADSPVEDPS